MRPFVAASFATSLVLVLCSRRADACAPAPPPGQSVRINGEEALIVWDEAAHIEHFVRTASFDSSAESFGFLVPTPSKPEIAEADGEVFDTLGQITTPVPVQQASYARPSGCGCFGAGAAAPIGAEPPPPVRVLAETRVAGLDTVVLEADSASALGDWLSAHGFELRDALKRWVAPYVEQKWKITAFRYTRPGASEDPMAQASPDSNGGAGVHFASRAVRLSFSADAPIYPYREPDDTPAVYGRELRVYLMSTREQVGLLTSGGPWSARRSYSGEVSSSRDGLARFLPGVPLPAPLWLQRLDDPASVRAPADIVFHPYAPATAGPPRSSARAPGPDGVPIPFAVPVVLGGLWWSRVRSRRKRSAVRPSA
jgi:hypothetical protein